MAYGNSVTVVGNMTRDPELRYTPSGASVCNFGVAYSRKDKHGQEQVSFFDVACWGTLAENVAASLTKGMRVVVSGELEQRSWESSTGDKRSKVEIKADDVAPSLRWASVQVERNPRNDNGGGGQPVQGRSYSNEEPF